MFGGCFFQQIDFFFKFRINFLQFHAFFHSIFEIGLQLFLPALEFVKLLTQVDECFILMVGI